MLYVLIGGSKLFPGQFDWRWNRTAAGLFFTFLSGSFRIYEVNVNEARPLMYADVPTSKPLRVLIRAYCLEGIKLACNSPIKDGCVYVPFMRYICI